MWAQFSPKYFEFLLTSGIWSTWVLLGGAWILKAYGVMIPCVSILVERIATVKIHIATLSVIG